MARTCRRSQCYRQQRRRFKLKSDQSSFRHWLRNLWLDNCDEHRDYGELPYTMQEYWDKYKWWLKREFRHQKNKETQ